MLTSIAPSEKIPVRRMLWWGRFDPDYSRNRILRQILPGLGWEIVDFQPGFSRIGDFEATLRRPLIPDLVWVPCFRQRDIGAARRWSDRHGVPLLIDPLISAYDKQIFERQKSAVEGRFARRLLAWERKLLRSADIVLADTRAHAEFFTNVLGAKRAKVVYVGAEERLFAPRPPPLKPPGWPCEVLFYGSFIPLHGAETIVEAARHYVGPPTIWRLIGNGPLLAGCRHRAEGLSHVVFEDWLPYRQLPERIATADILLGVFGATPKAGRVIPNKVFQSLACARPVITRLAPAYPEAVINQQDSGITWVEAGDAPALAAKVAELAWQSDRLPQLGALARKTYERYFSQTHIARQLQEALSEDVVASVKVA